MENDSAYPGQWVGFYEEEEAVPVFVLRCITDYTPVCLQRYNIFLPLSVQYFTVDKYSMCLRDWDNPRGKTTGSYHKVKVIHTNRGPTINDERKEVVFFYSKVTTFRWDPDCWRWADGGKFLDYTTKDGRDSIINKNPGTSRACDKSKGFYPVTINSFGHKCGTLYVVARKPHSFGPFGIRRWR